MTDALLQVAFALTLCWMSHTHQWDKAVLNPFNGHIYRAQFTTRLWWGQKRQTEMAFEVWSAEERAFMEPEPPK